MKIFTIGGSGLVGSRVIELLRAKYDISDLSRSTGVDITHPETLQVIENDRDHEVVIQFSAKADVDGCEVDKSLGENGEAYKINVAGVQNVVDVCQKTNKKIIYISTDFVFDGSAEQNSSYSELDAPNPINWYGETKYKGEEIVKNSGLPYIIARIAYPYRKNYAPKKDFARAILDRLKNNQPVAAIIDHIFTPTFIDDIASCIDVLIHHNKTGIYHVVGSQSLTPYEAAILIAEKFGLDKNLISKTTRAEYFKEKAPRPFNVSMNNDKIKQLGVKMRTFEEGLNSLL